MIGSYGVEQSWRKRVGVRGDVLSPAHAAGCDKTWNRSTREAGGSQCRVCRGIHCLHLLRILILRQALVSWCCVVERYMDDVQR
jgi:hypothetical protein